MLDAFMKIYFKALTVDLDLVLNDTNYPSVSIGYLATQCLLKWPVRSEVTYFSDEQPLHFAYQQPNIKQENNTQSKFLLLEWRVSFVDLNFAGASGRDLETKALVTVGSIYVFCTNQERKTQVCNQITATKNGKPQSNFGDDVLVLELPWKWGS